MALVVKKVILWLLVILNMASIFAFSSQPSEKSQATSGDFAYKVLETLSPSFRGASEAEKLDTVEAFQLAFRKGAHFSIYALLGLLIYLLLKLGYEWEKRAYLSPLFAAVYAVTDECHQMLVPGRSGLAGDVLIDFGGAVFGTLCAAAALYILRRSKNGRDC